MSTPDWSWIVFSEENAERARVALRDANQRIWATLAAVVVLVLFLTTQLESAAIPRAQQLVVTNTLVAAFFGYLLYMLIRNRGEVSRYFDGSFGLSSTRSTAEPGVLRISYPLLWRGSLVTAAWTVAIAAWFARDPSINDPAISFLWNDAGSYILMGNAILATINALRSSVRPVRSARPMPSLDPAFAEVLRHVSQLGARLVDMLIVLLAALFVRYSIGGIAALFSEPPSWIALGNLLGSGIALYVFEFWLGSLFLERSRLTARVQRLMQFHRELVGGQLTRDQAYRRYSEILGAGIPRAEPRDPAGVATTQSNEEKQPSATESGSENRPQNP